MDDAFAGDLRQLFKSIWHVQSFKNKSILQKNVQGKQNVVIWIEIGSDLSQVSWIQAVQHVQNAFLLFTF